MDLELAGKVAVVTGASKGIGLAVAQALVAEGAHVVAGARTHRRRSRARRRDAVAVDLATPTARRGSSTQAVERHGRVDVLVNNVGGVQLRLDGFLGVTDADFEWSMQLNFFAALRATRAAVAADARAGRRARSSTSRRSTRSSSPTAA